MVMLDANGARIVHRTYAPFGEVDTVAGDPFRMPAHFAGHLADEDSGLVYMQARWYDPASGTFLSVDPVVADAGDPQSYNAYAYTRNNPVSYNDPSGMCVIVSHCYQVQYGLAQVNVPTGPPTRATVSLEANGRSIAKEMGLEQAMEAAADILGVGGTVSLNGSPLQSFPTEVSAKVDGLGGIQLVTSGNIEGTPVGELTGGEWVDIGRAAAGMLGEIKDLTTTEFARRFEATGMLQRPGGDMELGVNQQVMIRDLNTIIHSSIRQAIAANLEAIRMQAILAVVLAPAGFAGNLGRAAAHGYRAAQFTHSGSSGVATATCGIGAGCGVTHRRSY